MMNRTAAGIFGIIMAAQLCLTPYAGVNVQAAQQEEEQLFEDASESDGSFEDVSDADVQLAENPANEFTENESEVDGFDDGNTESFSAGDDDQTQKEMQELVLNVQDGEDITVN